MDLSTTYLGLKLAHPFMAGASPLVDHLDTVRCLEDSGSSAIVMHSLFEEQISMARTGKIHRIDPLEKPFAARVADYPAADQYRLGPDEYLEQLRQIKAAVGVPVIASLNGTTAESWMTFARTLEQAGADALEMNVYEVVTDLKQPGAAVEDHILRLLTEIKHIVKIPVAVKLSPFFTAFANVAHRLDEAGADGLVLFNRFYQPDIDIDALKAAAHLELSTNAELLLRLRWLAILHGRVRASLAVSGGVAIPSDGIKAILAGAHAVQMVSAILRHGPSYFAVMRDALARWMDKYAFSSLDDARGKVSLRLSPDPEAFERANYIRALQNFEIHT